MANKTTTAEVVEFGLDTVGDISEGTANTVLSHAQVTRNVIEEGVLADSLGIDFFGLGEHHRDDFAVSAPEVVLSAIAARTRQIRLGTSVTVLSSDDPIRVFQRFSTLDAVSSGRAEVTLGRGSFTESFPLFGFDIRQYEQLFSEKLDLFVALLTQDPVTWRGKLRAPLENQRVFPPIEQGTLRAWIGVGGSVESVVRAARYGLPLMLAIIGGDPRRFRPLIELYHRTCHELGHTAGPVGVHSPGHMAHSDEQAREEFWPHFKRQCDRLGLERGLSPVTRAQFEHEIDYGSLYVGSPNTVAQRIAETIKALGIARFQLKYATGAQSHESLMRSIGLYGREVVPRVRELLTSSRRSDSAL